LLVTEKPELTFISPRFLFPSDSGGKIRSTQILRGLKGGAFRVRLVMPSSRQEARQFATDIDSVCDELYEWDHRDVSKALKNIQKLFWILHRYPVSVRADWSSSRAASVARALHGDRDVIVFDFPHSVVLAPPELSGATVLFTHNIEAEIFKRHWEVARFAPRKLIWRSQYHKMRKFEQKTLQRFDSVIAVSERDCLFFGKEYGVRECHPIPTGVDTEFLEYHEPTDRQEVVFCGSMDWMANIDGIEYFHDAIWPKIRKARPETTMKVVGRTPPESLVNRIQVVSPDWSFTGYVDDVRQHVGGAAVFVIPLRVGGGTRIKAFEAMAMGTPVVSTSVGIEGLPVADGEHFFAADDPGVFADKVIALLRDTELRLRISQAARKLVESRYGYRHAASVFERICLETMHRKRDEPLSRGT
jgi:glycosyltransferase involved in cell wall biosynthesis